MKRRVIFSHLPSVRYDSIDDMFEDVPIEDIQREDIQFKYMENRKREREREREREKDNGCFAGFLGFFRFFVNR
jgi:hypothetical protein